MGDRAAPVQRELFVGGEGDYHTYRIPALVVSTAGTLLAFCEGRVNDRGDNGMIHLLLKRSLDRGDTWTQTQVVRQDGPNTIGNPCPVVDRETGTIWLAFCRNNDRVFVTSSDDDGATWTAPREITFDVKLRSWGWFGTGPCHGLQLSTGRLLIPGHYNTEYRGVNQLDPSQFRPGHRSMAFFSDDHGETWQRGGDLTGGTDECVAVELEDGAVYLNMRTSHAKRCRMVVRSVDGGEIWTGVQFDETLIGPICQASAVRLSAAEPHDRNRVLFSNPASTTDRVRMTVRVSCDECRTWTEGRVLHEGPSAYSDLAVADDSTVFCLYERGETNYWETLTLARFDRAWLDG